MARRAADDTAYLEKRGRQWYAIRDIPRGLNGHFLNRSGQARKRLIICLDTEDVMEARRRRPAALAQFESRFAHARAVQAPAEHLESAVAWHNRIMAAAAEQRALIQRIRRGDTSGVYIDPEAPVSGTDAEKAMTLAVWGVEAEADHIADTVGDAAAEVYTTMALGNATLIEPLVDPWLAEEDIEGRSAGDHRRALNELVAWAQAAQRPATVETFNRRVAGEYVTHLLSGDLDRAKTVSKRLWSLSSFWRFLERKGHVDSGVNPWKGHSVGGGRSARDKMPERAFTAGELHALFAGPADPVLHDLMRLAFYSGARIEELAMLKAKDVDVGNRTMSVMADPKTPASRRVVPVHPDAWGIVGCRIKDKKPGDFVLHELGPEPEEDRERSMAVSKAFGRYRKKLKVHDKVEGQRRSLVNFHSFRRTFVTLCEQAAQPESTIRSVVGHKRDGMTFGVYSGGPSLDQRRACVEAVKLPTTA